MIPFVTSYFPGRIRLRAPFLKDQDIAGAMMDVVRASGLSDQLTYNPRTGSVLVEYCPERLPDPELLRPLIPSALELKDKLLFYSPRNKEMIISAIKELEPGLLAIISA